MGEREWGRGKRKGMGGGAGGEGRGTGRGAQVKCSTGEGAESGGRCCERLTGDRLQQQPVLPQ